ncbi:Clp [Theobroma cacao]|nr:Clp [Theobroma cacao]
MATYRLSFLPISISASQSLPSKRHDFRLSLPLSSLYGNKLLLKTSDLSLFVTKHHSSTTATVSFSLPTAKPERAPSEKSPKWSARSIKSFAMAELEARKLKYPNTGTEALLMGILVEGTSQAAKFLRDNGITLFKVREETVNLLGKSDMYFFSPEHPPLTEQAQRALDWAVDEKLKSGSAWTHGIIVASAGESGEITTTYLLLGIWSEKESAGYKILATLGFNDEKAKELTKYINEDIVLNYK